MRDWVFGLLIICKGGPFGIVFKFHFDTHRLLEGLGIVVLVGVSVVNVLIVVPIESLLSMSFQSMNNMITRQFFRLLETSSSRLV